MPLDTDIAVSSECKAAEDAAAELAAKLAIPVTTPDDASFPLLLVYTGERLEVRMTGPKAPGPVYVEFLRGKADYRRRYGSDRDEAVIKAVTSKRNRTPTVLDATGGLGRDAFVLASHGCRVTICEKHPVIAALLEDGIKRALADPGVGDVIYERLRLIKADSLEVLPRLPEDERPEVIYLDPMFPQKDKSALVKKEMQVLQVLLGEDRDSDLLLPTALGAALKRVVVKRPTHAPPIADRKPDLAYKTKKHRFDIYMV